MDGSLKYICFFILIPFVNLFAQSKVNDSLVKVINSGAHDTVKIVAMNKLAAANLYQNPDTAIQLLNASLEICSNINYQIGAGDTYQLLGVVYWIKSDYTRSLENYFKALSVWESYRSQKKISILVKDGFVRTLGNIGIVYKEKKEFQKSLEYFFKALKYLPDDAAASEMDKKRKSAMFGNIGIVYAEMAQSKEKTKYEDSLSNKALDYFFSALGIAEQLHAKSDIAVWLGNIGIVYKNKAESHGSPTEKEFLLNKALSCFTRALAFAIEANDKVRIAIWKDNIGSLYMVKGDYVKAEKYLSEAFKLADSVGIFKRTRWLRECIVRTI